MSNRFSIATLISVMVNAVVFGAGAILVLSVPALSANAWLWLPLVVIVSFAVSPFISWYLAPRLRAKWVRREAAREKWSRGLGDSEQRAGR